MVVVIESASRSSARPRARSLRRAFSLIELLIVIMILLALGGIVLVGYLGVAERADVDLQQVQFDQIDQAMRRFKLDLKRYPTDEEGLEVLWKKTSLEDEDMQARWRGPYLESPILEDTWGHELVYRAESEEVPGAYDLVSFGPNGEEGDEDDITNHDRKRDQEGEIDEEAFDDFSTDDLG